MVENNNPHPTTKIEKYEELYNFLSTQVLMEVNRFVTQKKLTNNQENINVEEVLEDAILTTMIRFQIYDTDKVIEMGYQTLDYSENADIMEESIREQYSFPVEIGIYLQTTKQIQLKALSRITAIELLSQMSEYTNLTRSKLFPWSEGSESQHVSNTGDDLLENVCRRIKTQIDSISSNVPQAVPVTLDVPITIFTVSKKVCTHSAFAEMNILAKDVSTMLMGDLMSPATDLLLECADKKK